MLRQRDLMMIEHTFHKLHDKGLYPETMTPIDKGQLAAVKDFGEDLLVEVYRLNKLIKVRKVRKREGI